jgi:hypothetical protein
MIRSHHITIELARQSQRDLLLFARASRHAASVEQAPAVQAQRLAGETTPASSVSDSAPALGAARLDGGAEPETMRAARISRRSGHVAGVERRAPGKPSSRAPERVG